MNHQMRRLYKIKKMNYKKRLHIVFQFPENEWPKCFLYGHNYRFVPGLDNVCIACGERKPS